MSLKGRIQLRSEIDKAAEQFSIMPPGISVETANYPSAYAEWIIPEGADESKTILYFHGGGFVRGNVNANRNIVSNFAKMVGYKALLFDYRLASEAPSLAAVDDSAAIYHWVLEQGYRPEDIAFAGDSAGGGIEISTLLKLRDEGLPMPAACVAFSPRLDMIISGDPNQPNASPIFGDLSGLPPIMIHVGNDEVLRDDSTRFGEKADYYGVDIRVKVWKGMFHCFPLLASMFEEATEAMNQVSGFIRQHLQKERGLAAAFLYMFMLPYF